MRVTKALLPTLRDVPAEAEIISHQLLVKAGFIRKSAAGIYSYLPLALRVLRKIETIVREEMDKTGAQELLLPIIQPAELWAESGRWAVYGDEMFRLKDRHNRDFCLGPTHEEIITDVVRGEVKSYKQLPLNLYQIQNKYRDERRPRFGLMRGREFIMKDAYSFDKDFAGLDESYQKMYEAYSKVYDRMGLNYRAVEADSGAIGGDDTHEFMVLAENGEATIAYCKSCSYASNVEITECISPELITKVSQELEKTATPDKKTIDEVAEFLNVSADKTIKTLVFKGNDEIVVVVVRGDRELNEIKLKRIVKTDILEKAEEDEIKALFNCEPGYISPINIENITVYADNELKYLKDAVCGANEEGYHYLHADVERDFPNVQFHDLREVVQGDSCPKCGGELVFAKGIEVGQVFKLGTKYSEKLNAKYLDENGKEQTMVMGCYGIGVSRTMAACVEQNYDEKGIIWPKSIAPYQVVVVPVQVNDELQYQEAEKLYLSLLEEGFEAVFDDRKERIGVKFNDADLIGYPLRITVGKKIVDGMVEFKERNNSESEDIDINTVISKVKEFYNNAK